MVACVAWQFWLGALSNKGGRGQRNREEIGWEQRQNRHATQAREIENNAYAKFCWANKVHYGKCVSGAWAIPKLP